MTVVRKRIVKLVNADTPDFEVSFSNNFISDRISIKILERGSKTNTRLLLRDSECWNLVKLLHMGVVGRFSLSDNYLFGNSTSSESVLFSAYMSFEANKTRLHFREVVVTKLEQVSKSYTVVEFKPSVFRDAFLNFYQELCNL